MINLAKMKDVPSENNSKLNIYNSKLSAPTNLAAADNINDKARISLRMIFRVR